MTEVTFNTFDSVKHLPLKSFNRAITAQNIMADYGKAELEKYYSNFDSKERWQILYVMKFMKKHGVEKTREVCTRDHIPEDEMIH